MDTLATMEYAETTIKKGDPEVRDVKESNAQRDFPDDENEEEPSNDKGSCKVPSNMEVDRQTSQSLIHKPKRKRRRRQQKIFQDSISVFIPINVTADLKIVIQRTRDKRIKTIYKRFPSLKQKLKDRLPKEEEEENNKEEVDDDDGENKEKENKKSSQKKQKKLTHVPQPHQYGSVLDYLEAKYVRGVMLEDDDEEGEKMEGGSEGQGSVYSGESFLDDTDLQRDVAEQVMANTTMTKLELEEDNADFFVNVGNLEVEDNQYDDHYDPLQDKESQPKTTTKKRKKPQSLVSPPKKKKVSKPEDAPPETPKSKKPAPQKKKKLSAKEAEQRKGLVAKAKKAKAKADALYKKVLAGVKKMTNEELPRRRTKLQVSLTCPANKKPGDNITFTNPHNPTQRLRVKIPKDCFPGNSFKVTIPVEAPPTTDDDKDHNKFPRKFQELVDEYARAYDEWCQAQSEVDKNFALYKEKQAKFDSLVKVFPSSLMTPIDANYLKKIVRRARQNKHKRKRTAAVTSPTTKVKEGSGSEEEESEDEGQRTITRKVNIPTAGGKFPSLKWNEKDFEP